MMGGGPGRDGRRPWPGWVAALVVMGGGPDRDEQTTQAAACSTRRGVGNLAPAAVNRDRWCCRPRPVL